MPLYIKNKRFHFPGLYQGKPARKHDKNFAEPLRKHKDAAGFSFIPMSCFHGFWRTLQSFCHVSLHVHVSLNADQETSHFFVVYFSSEETNGQLFHKINNTDY